MDGTGGYKKDMPRRSGATAALSGGVQDHAHARRRRARLACRQRLVSRLWRNAPEAGDQPNLQDRLAEMILAGEVKDGDRVAISTEGSVLTFNGKALQTAEIAQFEVPVPMRKLN
jgi:hypothetical protein